MMALIFTLALACDHNKIVCQTVCSQDGDQIGVIIDQKCYCANQRDLSKIVSRVPNSFYKYKGY
jgi:hypothetical protein